jgi:hypothetical protein
LCKAAGRSRGADLLALTQRDADGGSRGCIVEALWRFKSTVAVEPALRRLVHDPTVAGPALSSLQRTIGAAAMMPILDALLTDDNPRCGLPRGDSSHAYAVDSVRDGERRVRPRVRSG